MLEAKVRQWREVRAARDRFDCRGGDAVGTGDGISRRDGSFLGSGCGRVEVMVAIRIALYGRRLDGGSDVNDRIGHLCIKSER